ncbi:uncharacterized protein BXZ73DRAFT_91946 [Epithele typhae]|uniref:uncharacterized protein n=1 Tax=Epithele typhae TaxID=378194 RepID=UPI002008E809|nr:uncharacterized protein BXZ73DRAFT_91946 [Epithele typhae]KAH9920211.1 hypothetical protein BXZ73DRAFT_91946 [Epithele typhae]
MAENKSAFSLFSTLTLTGGRIPKPITLSRAESFPACRFNHTRGKFQNRLGGWKAADVPKHCGHLTLKLGERLGSGRSGWVYEVEAVSIHPPQGRTAPPILHAKSALCIKIARPNRCRTLAREAWVYERLPEPDWQGVITPRVYGFFTTTLPPNPAAHPPWYRHHYHGSSLESDDPTRDEQTSPVPSDDDPTRDDDLPDDEPKESYGEPGPGARELSEWLDWHPNPDAPLLSVLLMSRGGPAYSVADDDHDTKTLHDIAMILEDLSFSAILHEDIRPPNLLRAPADTQECPRHKCIHRWNLVDFPWSVVDERSQERGRD